MTMLLLIAIALLTIAALGSIFLAALIRLWREPPVLNVIIDIPDEFKLVLQKQPANVETDKPDTIPIPENILDYINLESDEWAQDARKKRARSLYRDSNDWNVVFRQLQREDTGFTGE